MTASGDGAHRGEQAEQAGLQHLRHLVQVVGGAAYHLAGLMAIEERQRQAVEFMGDAVAQLQVELFRKARHGEALQAIKTAGSRPNTQVDNDIAPSVIPRDGKVATPGKRLADAVPQHVDHARAVCWRGEAKSRVEDD